MLARLASSSSASASRGGARAPARSRVASARASSLARASTSKSSSSKSSSTPRAIVAPRTPCAPRTPSRFLRRAPSSSSSSSSARRRPRAFGDDQNGSLLDDLDADARCPVPIDQRPSSQLREIQESALLGWGGLELKWYLFRLGLLGTFFYFVIAYPIAVYSYDPATQPVEAIICALVGSLTATAAFALLIYTNWSYVRDRLLSATVEYEETGWYDGQTYVKDQEMLARDRLLGTYTVRPIVERLRKTLLACGAGVFVSLAALNSIDAPEYGVDGSAYYADGMGNNAKGYDATSAMRYEPSTPEEEAAEEEEEMRRYEAAMERYRADNARAAVAAARGESVEAAEVDVVGEDAA